MTNSPDPSARDGKAVPRIVVLATYRFTFLLEVTVFLNESGHNLKTILSNKSFEVRTNTKPFVFIGTHFKYSAQACGNTGMTNKSSLAVGFSGLVHFC